MEWQCEFESNSVTCFQQNIIKHSILLERSIQVISFRIVFWILMPKHYQCYKERSQHWDESTYNKSDFLDFSIFISISKLTSEYKLSSFVTKNIERGFSGDNFEILSLFPLTVCFFGAISSTMIISKYNFIKNPYHKAQILSKLFLTRDSIILSIQISEF